MCHRREDTVYYKRIRRQYLSKLECGEAADGQRRCTSNSCLAAPADLLSPPPSTNRYIMQKKKYSIEQKHQNIQKKNRQRLHYRFKLTTCPPPTVVTALSAEGPRSTSRKRKTTRPDSVLTLCVTPAQMLRRGKNSRPWHSRRPAALNNFHPHHSVSYSLTCRLKEAQRTGGPAFTNPTPPDPPAHTSPLVPPSPPHRRFTALNQARREYTLCAETRRHLFEFQSL